MNQKQLLAKRDELAQEYHLGELELYCTPQTPWELAKVTALCVLAVLVITPLYLLFHRKILYVFTGPVGVATLALFCLVMGYLIFAIVYLGNRTSAYVYSNGLVCLGWSGGRVVHWEEIRKVGIEGAHGDIDFLFVKLNDGTGIRFPQNTSQGSASNEALQKFIEEKMAQVRKVSDQ